jgi:hypothetical protein
MPEPATCSEGLAQNAPLPALLAEVAASMAKTLESHLPSLDLEDENARKERAVYSRLVRDLRQAAVLLRTSGEEMERARDLPAAAHDLEKAASPEAREAFARSIRAEAALADLLEQRLEANRALARRTEAAVRGS